MNSFFYPTSPVAKKEKKKVYKDNWAACGLLLTLLGIELTSPGNWECRILTTGPPVVNREFSTKTGNVLCFIFNFLQLK